MMEKLQAWLRGNARTAIVLSIVIVVVGELLLAWQYNRLAESQLPKLEQKIKEQQQQLEEQKAEGVVREFYAFRLGKDTKAAMRLLTEGAVVSWQKGEFSLTSEYYEDYSIEKIERVDDEYIRFYVTIFQGGGFPDLGEIVTVRKIIPLKEYYIDSVSLAG